MNPAPFERVNDCGILRRLEIREKQSRELGLARVLTATRCLRKWKYLVRAHSAGRRFVREELPAAVAKQRDESALPSPGRSRYQNGFTVALDCAGMKPEGLRPSANKMQQDFAPEVIEE